VYVNEFKFEHYKEMEKKGKTRKDPEESPNESYGHVFIVFS